MCISSVETTVSGPLMNSIIKVSLECMPSSSSAGWFKSIYAGYSSISTVVRQIITRGFVLFPPIDLGSAIIVRASAFSKINLNFSPYFPRHEELQILLSCSLLIQHFPEKIILPVKILFLFFSPVFTHIIVSFSVRLSIRFSSDSVSFYVLSSNSNSIIMQVLKGAFYAWRSIGIKSDSS